MTKSEQRIWEFAFRKAIERFLLNDEWTGCQGAVAVKRADEIVQRYRKANKREDIPND